MPLAAQQPRRTRMPDALDAFNEIQRIKYELWSEDYNVELADAAPQSKLVAEGDSWFDYPPGLDILDQLKRMYGYKIYKVAEAGDTIENMAYGTEIRRNFTRRTPQLQETRAAIERHRPKVFLLSGGGNDLAGEELEAFLDHKDSKDAGAPLIRQDYVRYVFFEVFKNAYEHIMDEVWGVDSDIHILGHGYGNPTPDGRAVRFLWIKFAGPWLRPALARKNITNPSEAKGIMHELIRLFNEMLKGLDDAHPNFHYLDLRDRIEVEDWVNELHLSSEAYGRVAGIFHQEIQKYV
jgi:hypothetical protein